VGYARRHATGFVRWWCGTPQERKDRGNGLNEYADRDLSVTITGITGNIRDVRATLLSATPTSHRRSSKDREATAPNVRDAER
jgi:hypothetical protein